MVLSEGSTASGEEGWGWESECPGGQADLLAYVGVNKEEIIAGVRVSAGAVWMMLPFRNWVWGRKARCVQGPEVSPGHVQAEIRGAIQATAAEQTWSSRWGQNSRSRHEHHQLRETNGGPRTNETYQGAVSVRSTRLGLELRGKPMEKGQWETDSPKGSGHSVSEGAGKLRAGSPRRQDWREANEFIQKEGHCDWSKLSSKKGNNLSYWKMGKWPKLTILQKSHTNEQQISEPMLSITNH